MERFVRFDKFVKQSIGAVMAIEYRLSIDVTQ